MILARFEKQPYDVKDYEISYSEWLGGTGDTLDQVTATVVCTTNPIDSSLTTNVNITVTKAVIWVTGGIHGNKYKITVRADTVMGRRDEVELIFSVKDY